MFEKLRSDLDEVGVDTCTRKMVIRHVFFVLPGAMCNRRLYRNGRMARTMSSKSHTVGYSYLAYCIAGCYSVCHKPESVTAGF